VYRGSSTIIHTPEGDFEGYAGVPNAWGFLMFCAGWTILVVIFQTVTRDSFADRPLFSYVRVGAELLAVLSWFAGWIAVAVNIGTAACLQGYMSCSALKAAAVFGAVEWLLFTVTGILAISLFLNSKRQSKASTIPRPVEI
jgi:hypothetical protein